MEAKRRQTAALESMALAVLKSGEKLTSDEISERVRPLKVSANRVHRQDVALSLHWLYTDGFIDHAGNDPRLWTKRYCLSESTA